MYVGYILAMMALVDNGASKDTILAVRDYIRPNLMGHHFDDRMSLSVNIKMKNIVGLKRKRADHRDTQ